jgi:Glyoxalase-like domain
MTLRSDVGRRPLWHTRGVLAVGTVVMGAEDVRRAAAFWTRALGYVPRDGVVEDDWVVLVPPDRGTGTRIALGLSDTPVQEHPRIHLDLYAGDAADQAAEVERLAGLGATRVDWDLYPDDPDFVVLADTEGNRFCVIDTGRG